MLNTLVFGGGLGGVTDPGSTEQKHQITMSSVLPDSDLYAFSLDDFDLCFFLPCVVFAHMYVQVHTPMPVCMVARAGCWSAPLDRVFH